MWARRVPPPAGPRNGGSSSPCLPLWSTVPETRPVHRSLGSGCWPPCQRPGGLTAHFCSQRWEGQSWHQAELKINWPLLPGCLCGRAGWAGWEAGPSDTVALTQGPARLHRAGAAVPLTQGGRELVGGKGQSAWSRLPHPRPVSSSRGFLGFLGVLQRHKSINPLSRGCPPSGQGQGPHPGWLSERVEMLLDAPWAGRGRWAPPGRGGPQKESGQSLVEVHAGAGSLIC